MWIPPISKPRVTSSNLVGRAKQASNRVIILGVAKRTQQIFLFIYASVHQRSTLRFYIKSNPYLLAILNSEQVESKDIVLHRLVPLLNQRRVRFKFATYGLASAVASARPSFRRRLILNLRLNCFMWTIHLYWFNIFLLWTLYCLIQA